MSLGGFVDSGDIERDLENLIKIRITSDQKEWIMPAVKLTILRTIVAIDYIEAYNRAVYKIFHQVFDEIILSMLPLVPLDTGRLRAGFVNAFKLHIATNSVGSITETSTIEFDLAKLLNEVPYARYFISEITGKEFIEVPTTTGTTPIELHIITERLKFIPIQIVAELKAQGWDAIMTESRAFGVETTEILSGIGAV